MTRGIQITSVEAVSNLRTSLVRYRHDVEDLLLRAEMEAKRVMAELKDSLAAAARNAERCREDVAYARADLNICLRAIDDEDEGEPDCSDEEQALCEAEDALREAEERVEGLRHARVFLTEAFEGYRSKAEYFSVFLEVDLSHADSTLAKKIGAVEEYLAVTTPGIVAIPLSIPPFVASTTVLAIGVRATANVSLGVGDSSTAPSFIARPIVPVASSHDPLNASTDYRVLRKRTPCPEIRRMVNSQGANVDPVYGHRVAKLEPDHIVPVNEIVRMPGFADLPKDTQVAILNMPINFLGVSREVNASRGTRSWEDWRGHSRFGPVPESVREGMILRERRVRLRIQQSIDEGSRHE